MDIHCHTTDLKLCRENFCTFTRREAGGKGINISRALRSYCVPSTALTVLGKENREDYLKALYYEELDPLQIVVDGRIRENITVHTESGEETRISFDGFAAPSDLMEQVKILVEPLIEHESILTFTGSMPVGVSKESVKVFLKYMEQKGARIVIDCRAFGLEDLQELRPWLIKPNEQEIVSLLHRPVQAVGDAAAAARQLYEKGIENVMISLGKQGAVYCGEGGCSHVLPPRIRAVSTIGAGDASVAGFIVGTLQGEQGADCLRRAVSFGTAACLREGTLPPEREQIDEIYAALEIKPLL